MVEVQMLLGSLYWHVKNEGVAWFPFNRNESAFVAAIARASRRLNEYPPAGTTNVGNLFSENFSNNNFRVDVENRFGHNLRFRV